MSNLIQIKRGLKTSLPNLEVGEFGLATDTNELFIGTPTGNELVNIDPNEMAYFDYAGNIYGDKYSLLASAWEHSLTVDPTEISADGLFGNSERGKAQYPNGETEGIIIPQGVINIGSGAFSNWSANNQPLVIPNSVTSIGTTAFYAWTKNNQPLIIPNSVTSIGMYTFAFWYANNQPLTIPNSVTSIEDGAFQSWYLVPYIEIQAITPPTLASRDAFSEQNNAPIYVPDESVEAYKTATNWVSLADRIFPISDMSGVNSVNSVNGKTGTVVIDKSDVGLPNVDDTADLDKPISTATQTALNLKADKTQLNNYVTTTTFDMQMLEKLAIKPNGSDLLIIDGMINPLYIDDTSYKVNHPTVNSQAAMLALDVPAGTVVVRLDTTSKELFLLTQLPASTLANWQLVSSNTVVSVAGKTGVVVLGITDISGLNNALNLKLDITKFESQLTQLQSAIAAKQDKLVAGDNITIDNNVISAIDDGVIVDLGAFADETQLITHVIMNQLPTGHYTFIMNNAPAFVLLERGSDRYFGTFHDTVSTFYYFEVSFYGEIYQLKTIDLRNLTELADLADLALIKADITYVDSQDALKADITYVDGRINSVGYDITQVYERVDDLEAALGNIDAILDIILGV